MVFKMFVWLITLISLFGINIVSSVTQCGTISDYYKLKSTSCTKSEIKLNYNISEVLQTWGFKTEEYTITTPDGYNLLLVRTYKNENNLKAPIILGHSSFANGLAFVTMGNKSLAYILGNLGYDIWITNMRGTRFSRTHVNLTANTLEYWQYSLYEVGVYDTSTFVNKVYEITKERSIFIGWGSSNAAACIYSSLKPKEAKKTLKGIIVLGPKMYFAHIKSAFLLAGPVLGLLTKAVDYFWKGEFIPRYFFNTKICGPRPFGFYLCETIKGPFEGFDYQQIDLFNAPLTEVMTYDSEGYRVTINYYQIHQTKIFQGFDWGKEENLRRYGSKRPIKFNLNKIPVPVSMFVGKNDFYSSIRDSEEGYNKIAKKNRCGFKILDNPHWNHNDFVFAKDVVKDVYDSVVDLVENGQCTKTSR